MAEPNTVERFKLQSSAILDWRGRKDELVASGRPGHNGPRSVAKPDRQEAVGRVTCKPPQVLSRQEHHRLEFIGLPCVRGISASLTEQI